MNNVMNTPLIGGGVPGVGSRKRPDISIRWADDHDPSMDIDKIRLLDGSYLIQRWTIAEGEQNTGKTESGLFIVIKEKTLMPNAVKVIKRADKGCTLAEVGEYLILPVYRGDSHTDKLFTPLIRQPDDKDYGIVFEKYAIGALPAADVEEE